jgi:predicted RNA binding protein YcfA (HicA-like mRNA interferase family)
MQNLSYENKGWLSLSFPQLTAKEAIKNIQTQGFKSVQAYPKGSSIYHNEHKKAVKSTYLLVEGEDTQWSYNDTHSITLSVVPPSTEKELILDIRGNFKSKEKSIMLPNEYEGIKGQQGFTNYRVFIAL